MPCSVCQAPLEQLGRRWVCPVHGGKAMQEALHEHAPEPGLPMAASESWERLEALETAVEGLGSALTALAARMGRLEAAMAPKAILGAILAEGDRQMREDVEAEEADRARETGLQAARDRLRPQEG